MSTRPGPIVLFGSGETAANAQRVYTWLFKRMQSAISVAVLETPAGFQPNSAQVAGDIAVYVEQHLVNFNPAVTIVPARQRGTPFSTESPEVLDVLARANVLLAGPGSPTYAVRQLRDSPAWEMIRARHRLGAALVFSSAATLAVSRLTLPVYEIYKVGEELHWQRGLDLLADFGLSTLLVSHWNNNDGGAGLDTSRCYIGEARFHRLQEMLPHDPARILVGIDEKTALCLDLVEGVGAVYGAGTVTLVRDGKTSTLQPRRDFSLSVLGDLTLPAGGHGIDAAIWARAGNVSEPPVTPSANDPAPPEVVQRLVQERQAVRERRDWAASDRLRDAIAAQGWRVTDTPEGPSLSELQ